MFENLASRGIRTAQSRWVEGDGWTDLVGAGEVNRPQLGLVFGSPRRLRERSLIEHVQQRYPGAAIYGCSTAGEILGGQVTEDSLVVTWLEFATSWVKGLTVPVAFGEDSYRAGLELGERVDAEDLVILIVLSDGTRVNGSELLRGIAERLPAGVKLAGGLAGDGDRFRETLVLAEGKVDTGVIAAIGLYGKQLEAACGSKSGWDSFGVERRISRSVGNVLYELDGESALALYKRYLGEHAAGLPGSGLHFPLAIRPEGTGTRTLVRTILGVNEEQQSMTFAGDMPEGWYARLMRANLDRLVDGSAEAAGIVREELRGGEAQVAVLVSCVGRRLVLRQRVEEEVEAVQEVMGVGTALTGFYSYGELAPAAAGLPCELHNQTMTMIALREN
jgi:hypothetical protein